MCCSHGVVRYVIVGQSASQTLDSVVVNAWELTGQRIPSPLPSTHRAGRQPRNCFHIISRSPSSVFTCSSPVLAMALPGKQFTAPVLRPTGISAPPRLYVPARPVRRRHGAPPTRPFAPPAQSAKLGLVAAISETVRPFDSLSESPCGGPPGNGAVRTEETPRGGSVRKVRSEDMSVAVGAGQLGALDSCADGRVFHSSLLGHCRIAYLPTEGTCWEQR